MINDIKKYLGKIIFIRIKDEKQLEQFRLEYLSKKGLIQKFIF